MLGNYKTTPFQLLDSLSAVVPPPIDLGEIQGDILIGLQKKFEIFIFFEIQDVASFRDILRKKIASHVTTTKDVRERELDLADRKRKGDHTILPLLGLNIAFTKDGLKKLQPGITTTDTPFNNGAAEQAPALGDPTAAGKPSTWLADYLSGDIDGVLLITGGILSNTSARAQEIQKSFGAALRVIRVENGQVRPGAEAGHEHFGWQDGISQPGIAEVAALFPGQRSIDPGEFVFGVGNNQIEPMPMSPGLAKNGSFMVFRRLLQKVPEFNQFVLSQSSALGIDPVILGARMVGRWKSGAPLDSTPSQDDLETGKNPDENNNFDYSTDQGERRCPFGAHIRKANPRSDFDPVSPDLQPKVDPRRIIRQGIPFGPEVTDKERVSGESNPENDRGLLFVCYQAQIAAQFEFLQISWIDNPTFISPVPVPKTQPFAPNSVITVGADPIVGRSTPPTPSPQPMEGPVSNYPTGAVSSRLTALPQFVLATGGAYCFSPSITALKFLL